MLKHFNCEHLERTRACKAVDGLVVHGPAEVDCPKCQEWMAQVSTESGKPLEEFLATATIAEVRAIDGAIGDEK